MKKALTITFLSYCLFIQLSHASNDTFYLYAETCEELDIELQAFSDWKALVHGQTCNPQTLEKTVDKYNSCQADAISCLPEHVKKYHGANPKVRGPNCWNLALVMSDILPNLRNSPREEISFYMQPPLCRQLANGETREPGDIGLIRDRNYYRGIEYHAFIHISDKLVYSKNGADERAPFAIQTLKNVFDVYQMESVNPLKCLENKLSDECSKGTEYFRCQSLDDYLSNKKTKAKEIYQPLDHVECVVGQATSKGLMALTDSNLKNIKDSVFAIEQLVDKQLSNQNPLDETESFIYKSAKLRIDGLRIQLGNLEKINYIQEVSDSLDHLRKALLDSYNKIEDLLSNQN